MSIQISPTARLLTKHGSFLTNAIRESDNLHPTTLVLHMGVEDSLGNSIIGSEPVLLRIQSACLTSTALGSLACDCAAQMERALQMIAELGRGIFIYLDDEGRGNGLFQKVCGIAEMNRGESTVTAYTKRGISPDVRNYDAVGLVLKLLQVRSRIDLLTNNPAKITALKAQGCSEINHIGLEIAPTPQTREYLLSKKNELGHLLTLT